MSISFNKKKNLSHVKKCVEYNETLTKEKLHSFGYFDTDMSLKELCKSESFINFLEHISEEKAGLLLKELASINSFTDNFTKALKDRSKSNV